MQAFWRLIRLVDSLSGIPRIGWVSVGVRDAETVAEHILLTSYIAVVLAKEAGLDEARAALMALVHDVAEASLGNAARIIRDRVGLSEWRRIEGMVVDELGFGSEFRDYVNQETPEARLVALSDKLATFLRACQYAKMGYDSSGLVKYYAGEVKESSARLGNDKVSRLIEDILRECLGSSEGNPIHSG